MTSSRRQSFGWADPEMDWFMDLFGFCEPGYQDTQRRLRVWQEQEHPEAPWFMEGENGRRFQVGRFWTPSLRELREFGEKMGGPAALKGRLSVRNVRGDVSKLLGVHENRHATFQVASQFNCLEFMDETATPEDGVTKYVWDRTQGPACSIACGPATVYRNYFAPVDGHIGQTSGRQLDNLRDLSRALGNEPDGHFFTTKSGYTLATSNGLRQLNAAMEQLPNGGLEELLGELRVGVQEDTQVTSTDWGSCPVEDEKQTVTQVFGSACSVSYSGNDQRLWEPLARLVLTASYEATLWAGLLTALRHRGRAGSKRVFLTCLGGGVFGNNQHWIVDAMREALDKFQGCGLDVSIVTYTGPYDRGLVQLERDFSGP